MANHAQPAAPNSGFAAPKPKPKEKKSDIVKSIVAGAEKKGEKKEKLLGLAPELDRSLLEEIEAPTSFMLILLKVLFWLLVVASAASFLFFTFQLSDTFDFVSSRWSQVPSVQKQIISSNAEILNFQTDLNFFRMLQAKSYLDEITYHGDSYLQFYEVYTSQTTTNAQKSNAKGEMNKLREPLSNAFNAAKALLIEPLYVDLIVLGEEETQVPVETQFQTELKNDLKVEADKFAQSDDPDARRENKNYIHTMRLVGNAGLVNLMVNTDFDALTDEELYNFIKELSLKVTNELSIIQQIKSARIRWSDIINEIDLRTKAIDTYFSQDLYDDYGGIRYTSYDFDSTARTISIVGETKRFDTTNFTMISNLIEELNRSVMFGNAEMRAFTKSGSLDDGYTASLKLTLNLTEDEINE